MTGQPGKLFYVVRTFVDRKMEEEWDEWQTKSYIPDVLKQPGFLRVSKFRRANASAEGEHEYWTVYEMRDEDAFETYNTGDAASKLGAYHKASFGDSTGLERFVLLKTAGIPRPRRNA